MKIDKELISYLENLARLDLSEKERKDLLQDLNAILKMVDKLTEVESEEVEPLVHMTNALNDWREDIVKGEISTEKGLSNAPLEDGIYVKVKKVIKTN